MKKVSVAFILSLSLVTSLAFAQQQSLSEVEGASQKKVSKFSSHIICSFYAANDRHGDLEIDASFSSQRAPSTEVQLAVGKFTAVLTSNGGDGGEPGNVELEIQQDGKMIHKTLWQAGDALSKPGQKSGLNYVNEAPAAPGGAELQYYCSSK